VPRVTAQHQNGPNRPLKLTLVMLLIVCRFIVIILRQSSR
jgi:hypothetical protein